MLAAARRLRRRRLRQHRRARAPTRSRPRRPRAIYYADGTTEMARLGDENRTNVTLDQISKPARYAVLAAENRSFYTDPGISFTGIVRAAFNNVTGGSTQGGSTITQQYVKNAILKNSEQTFTRKFQELFLAIKLDNNYSKDQILENYLNTIYYGRGAYGIESAANTYFGVPGRPAHRAAGRRPRRPGPQPLPLRPRGQPRRTPRTAGARCSTRWWTRAGSAAEERARLGLPAGAAEDRLHARPARRTRGSDRQGGQERADEQVLLHRAADRRRWPADHHDRSTRTTRTPPIAAVADVMEGEPDTLRQALVVGRPEDRRRARVLRRGERWRLRLRARRQRQPGSSVKPYVLATALENGHQRDRAPRRQRPADVPGPAAGQAGAQLGRRVLPRLHPAGGDHQVAEHDVLRPDLRAGPEERPRRHAQGDRPARDVGRWQPQGQDDAGRPGDRAAPTPVWASGSTRCARSTRPSASPRSPPAACTANPYFVAKVTDSEGNQLLGPPADDGEQVIPADVANDVTYRDQGRGAVLQAGARGRPRGRQQDRHRGHDRPGQLRRLDGRLHAVDLDRGLDGDPTRTSPIATTGGKIIYGSGLPGAIWQEFMNAVLDGDAEGEPARQGADPGRHRRGRAGADHGGADAVLRARRRPRRRSPPRRPRCRPMACRPRPCRPRRRRRPPAPSAAGVADAPRAAARVHRQRSARQRTCRADPARHTAR